MISDFVTHARRSLLAALLTGSVLTPLAVNPTVRVTAAPADTSSSPATSAPMPPPGTDLYHLDTDTRHYMQGEGDHTRLALYNSPAGIADFGGWRQRDTRLIPAQSQKTKLKAADTHFDLQIAPSSGQSQLATLTSEDGVTLGLGLMSLNGGTPSDVTGQVNDDTVTYRSPVAASPSDVAVRATASGLNVRVTLHSADEVAPIALSLALDPRTYLKQQSNGVIVVTQPITDYGDDPSNTTPIVTQQPEYIVETPSAIDSATDPAAAVQTGPVSMSLTPLISGGQGLTLTVDPAWAHDAHRVFPVHLDLPILTGESGVHTGLFGTVSSCAPNTPVPPTGLVVGSENGCAYHGQVYFNTSSLLYDTPIVSATLRLYTPNQAGATSVQVYPNVAPTVPGVAWQPLAWQPPDWNSAPTVVTGSVGLGQSASEGHWQNWDVTSLVSQWVRDPRTNGGLTLTNDGAPIRFASPLGAGNDKPAFAPVLDIVYGPRPVNPAYIDVHGPSQASLSPHILSSSQSRAVVMGRSSMNPQLRPHAAGTSEPGATSIYGLSGTFAPNATYNPALGCPAGAKVCGDASGGGVNLDQVRFLIGSGFVRFNVQLECFGSPSLINNWWNQRGSAPFNGGSAIQLIQNAYHDNLIPIINLVPPASNSGNCSSSTASFRIPLNPVGWSQEVNDFVKKALAPNYSATGADGFSRRVYFEIGNEPNLNTSSYQGTITSGNYSYEDVFGSAAQSIQGTFGALGSTQDYRVLTGGMAQPTANSSCFDITNSQNVALAGLAISDAEGNYSNIGVHNSVSPSHLGVAVHPYAYTTPELVATSTPPYYNGYWRNYGSTYQSSYALSHNAYYHGPCSNLNDMINLWAGQNFPGLPVLFTEDNWNDHIRENTVPAQYGGDPNGASPDGPNAQCTNITGCEGNYLADLYTWMQDHGGNGSPYYNGTSNTPIRVLYFNGADYTDTHGVYQPFGIYGANTANGAGEKGFNLSQCPTTSSIQGNTLLSSELLTLIGSLGCY